MAASKSIQVIATRAEARLPVEFIYDREAPTSTAPLCPKARAALPSGTCTHTCPPGDEQAVICPFAFWGMSRVIERHAHRAKYTQALGAIDFAMQAEPTSTRPRMRVLREGLLAATDRVRQSVPGAVDGLRSTIDGATDESATIATSWAEWCNAVSAGSPSLLALIVHTEPVAPGDTMARMEIGTQEWLASVDIKPSHIRGHGGDPPLVLLLGCETGAPDVSFLGFVAEMRYRGAGIVVSAGSKIHAAHAVPTLEAFVKELSDMTAADGTQFGEVMRRIRCALVAKDLPMVLCLTAYGDADWLLTR
jgi:hypothetical protein